MSAFDKVEQARRAAEAAHTIYKEFATQYDLTISKAAQLIEDNRLKEAGELLDAAGFGKDEPLEKYHPLWMATLHQKSHDARVNPLDTAAFHWLQERAPMEPVRSNTQFWSTALRKGSSTIVEALLPHYKDAGEAWHYNWEGGDVLPPSTWLEGREDRLMERLKTFNLLLDAGLDRLNHTLERLVQYAGIPDLSPEATTLLENTYIKCLNKHVELGRTQLLDPSQWYACPPRRFEAAYAHYMEEQNKYLSQAQTQDESLSAEKKTRMRP